MANDLNQCNFIGRLGRDLELRTFPSGDQVANGTLAVGSKWKDRNSGEAKESTEWVRLNFHGKSAEIAAQYLRKGSQIFVTGEMRTREYEQDGVKKYTTEIRVNNFQMLGQRPEGEGRAPAPAPSPRQQSRAPAPSTDPGGWSDMDDGEIPFMDPLKRRGVHLVL